MAIVFVAVLLIARLHPCFGDSPLLSITSSNTNIMLTWPQTSNNWVVVEMTKLTSDYFVSNGVTYYIPRKRNIIPTSSYGTNGNNLFVVLPIDFSTNKFYMLQTNNLPPPPPPH